MFRVTLKFKKTLLAIGIVWTAMLLGCNALTHRNDSTASRDQPTGKWNAKFAATKQRIAKARKPSKVASHQRDWRSDLAVLPYADIRNDRVRLYNIRNCNYRTETDYDVRHFDREILLADVRTIDFIVVPFRETPLLAHTMLSFGLADGEHIVYSVEARLQKGQSYAAIGGAMKRV